MPHSVAFDLGLHCLSMSHKMDAIGLNGLMTLFQCFYSLAGDLPPSWIRQSDQLVQGVISWILQIQCLKYKNK